MHAGAPLSGVGPSGAGMWSSAAAGSGAAPPSWVGHERIEFDEPSAGASDSGWTVGYLDVLLLLVTLFAALLGATYLQLDELRANASSEPAPTAAPASHPPPNATVATAALGQSTGAGKLPVASDMPRLDPVPPVAKMPMVDPVPAVDGVSSSDDGPMVNSGVMGDSGPRVDTGAAVIEGPVARGPAVGNARSVTGAVLGEATAGEATRGEAMGNEATAGDNAVAAEAFAMPREFEPLARLVAAHHEQQAIELLFDRHQLRLEVGNDILFPSGTATLSAAGAELLVELSAALLDERLQISVEGHTDDVPIATAQFPSNWELSSIRATTVARHLIALGIPEPRLRVTGHADTRPRVRNDSAANRALNRRVSLVLEIADGSIAPRTPAL